MKRKLTQPFFCACLVCMMPAPSALAAGAGNDDTLIQQIHLLMEQNKQLEKRIHQLEEQQSNKPSVAVSDDILEKKITKILRHKEQRNIETDESSRMLKKSFEFNGVVEVEGSVTDNFEEIRNSSLELSTVELGFVGRVTDWASAHITLLYEERGDDKVLVDDAHIFIGNTDQFPFYLNGGRIYVPFGNFTSNMISDPLTLEIAECQETALQVGFMANGTYGSIFAFNGDTNRGGGASHTEQFGANIGYSYQQETLAVDFGLSYINSMGDSDGLSAILEEHKLLEADYVDGLGVYAAVSCGPVTLTGEYITALADYDLTKNSQPMAFNLEAGYSFTVGSKNAIVAMGFQGTDDMVGYLPKNRFLGSISLAVLDGTTLAFEYIHDQDYDEAAGGTDKSSDSFTGQLAYAF